MVHLVKNKLFMVVGAMVIFTCGIAVGFLVHKSQFVYYKVDNKPKPPIHHDFPVYGLPLDALRNILANLDADRQERVRKLTNYFLDLKLDEARYRYKALGARGKAQLEKSLAEVAQYRHQNPRPVYPELQEKPKGYAMTRIRQRKIDNFVEKFYEIK